MITTGSSLHMRQVSRTHRVDFDGFSERTNSDPCIAVQNANTTQQVADMMTKGSFTCDKWNQLLFLSNVLKHNYLTAVFLQHHSLPSVVATSHVKKKLEKTDRLPQSNKRKHVVTRKISHQHSISRLHCSSSNGRERSRPKCTIEPKGCTCHGK